MCWCWSQSLLSHYTVINHVMYCHHVFYFCYLFILCILFIYHYSGRLKASENCVSVCLQHLKKNYAQIFMKFCGGWVAQFWFGVPGSRQGSISRKLKWVFDKISRDGSWVQLAEQSVFVVIRSSVPGPSPAILHSTDSQQWNNNPWHWCSGVVG